MYKADFIVSEEDLQNSAKKTFLFFESNCISDWQMCEVSFFEVLDEQVVDLLQPDKPIQSLGHVSTVSVATESDASAQ